MDQDLVGRASAAASTSPATPRVHGRGRPVSGRGRLARALLGIAVPARLSTARLRASATFERTADAFEDAARLGDYRASLYRAAGHLDDETRERQAAARSRELARR